MGSKVKSKKISVSSKGINSSNKVENPIFGFDLFDSLPDMYFLLDANGEIIRLNKKAEEIIKTDLTPAPSNFLDLVDLCNREKVNNIFFQCISSGKISEIETQFLLGQKTIDVQLTFTIYKTSDDEKKLDSVFVVAKNISDEKAKEVELQRFFNIVESSLNPIQITDFQGKMIYVNPAFVKSSGYTKEELIGNNPKIFGSSKMPKKFWDKMWQTISSGKVWFGEIEDRRKNGEAFYTQLLISPIFDKEAKSYRILWNTSGPE